MKNILVPVDFNDCSRNAGFYAVEMAKKLKSRLFLYHAYTVASTVTNYSGYAYHYPGEKNIRQENRRAERENLERLKFLKETILKGKTTPYCKLVQEKSYASSGVAHYASQHDIDLIVMGTHCRHAESENLIARETWKVIQRSNVPVLAVPENCRAGNFSQFCMATHLKETDMEAITAMTQIAQLFNANLHVVHVSENPGSKAERNLFRQFVPAIQKKATYRKLKLDYIEHKDISVALAEYFKKVPTDLLAVSSQSMGWMQKLFCRDSAHMLDFHTQIPLLKF